MPKVDFWLRLNVSAKMKIFKNAVTFFQKCGYVPGYVLVTFLVAFWLRFWLRFGRVAFRLRFVRPVTFFTKLAARGWK